MRFCQIAVPISDNVHSTEPPQWLRANPNDQAKYLLYKLGSQNHSASEADAVVNLLRRIDIVATLDRFDDLVRLLCARLALPRCPCYKSRNSSPKATFAAMTTKLQREYNKSSLSPSAQFLQMGLSHDGVEKTGGEKSNLRRSLRAQVLEVAWIDERTYAWASTHFSTIIAAEGLLRGRENTTMEC